MAYYWFFIPASAMSLADVAGMCPARDLLLESAAGPEALIVTPLVQ